jgi:hypothetical protein
MKTRWLLVVALLLGFALGTLPAGAVSAPADEGRISRLISQLASLKFAERRQASRELDSIGEPALAALRKAMSAEDMETCHRAGELVAKIEKRLDDAAVIAPTRVRLVCKDMPVPDAIAELSRKSKIEILIEPNSRARLAQRNVTLDTGEVTFWEALDLLCQKAGLVETTLQTAIPSVTSYTHTTRVLQPQAIKPLILPAQPLNRVILPAQPANKAVPAKPRAQPQKPRDVQAQPQNPRVEQAQPQKPKAPQAQPQKAKDTKAQPQDPKDAKAQPQKAKPLQPQAAARAAQRAAVFQKLVLANVPAQAPPAPQIQIRQLAQVQVLALDDLAYLPAPAQDLSRIVLADGKTEAVPTCYTGAFRIRARANAGKDKQSAGITFEVTAEPRHLGWNLVGNPRLDRAGDDRGQVVTLLLEPKPMGSALVAWGGNVRALEVAYFSGRAPSAPLKRTVQIQIRLGEKPGKLLSEMTGHITVEANTPSQPLIVVDDIGKATGKTVKGARGGALTILEVAKDNNGNYQIRYKLESPPSCAGSGNLSLVDGKGAALPIIGSSVTNTRGDIAHSMTFQAQQGRAPARLVFSAQHRVNVDVPFAFKNVKLP